MPSKKTINTTKPGDIHALLDTALNWGFPFTMSVSKVGEKPTEGIQAISKKMNGDQKLSETIWGVEMTIYGEGDRDANIGR